MIKMIIFDFDGVIVESVDIKTKAFAKLFNPEGKETVKEIVDYHLKHGGVSRFEKFRYIYKNILKRKLTKTTFEDLCQRFSSLVLDGVAEAPYVNGAKEFLDKYAGLYKCFVASGTPQDEIEDIIRRRNISHYFAGIYGAPQNKIKIARKILLSQNYSPSEIVYIGDALSDYEAAIANGLNFIARVDNNSIFDNINCIKVKDLINLRNILESI